MGFGLLTFTFCIFCSVFLISDYWWVGVWWWVEGANKWVLSARALAQRAEVSGAGGGREAGDFFNVCVFIYLLKLLAFLSHIGCI